MVDNFSRSDSGMTTMSPMGTSGTDTTPTSPNIFDLEVFAIVLITLCLMRTTVTMLMLMLATLMMRPTLKITTKKMQKMCQP